MKIVKSLRPLTLVILLLSVLGMTAANVDSRVAQDKAVRFLNSQPNSRFMASSANVKLTHTEASAVSAGAADYYVFNYDDGGYVIVSGDDRAEEILGYGSGYMDVQNLPSNVAWWLGSYKTQMEFLIAHPELKVQTSSQVLSTMLTATSVPMLMTSTWDQEAPYYNQCPKYNNQYCMTGCVATAMAQVMYYWKFPAELPALPSYVTAEAPRFTVPALPGITLDWANMLDDYSSVSYNTTQANAVAWLMRYCGQAVEMMYSPDGSGAYTEDERDAMVEFGYSEEATVKYRDDYSNASQWHALMQAELTAGRPILYGGNDYNAGGHAFVVDGYNASTNKYHVNFGWSGYDDNYYALDAFTGSGYTFSYYQDMIIGVYPASTIETYAPVMADASNVGTTSFKATWTDQTPSENVTDYTLYVQAYDPNHQTLLTEAFSGVTASSDQSTNISNSLDQYCDNAGWTGSYVYQAGGGGLKLGNSSNGGSLTTPALDLSTSNGTITVALNANRYGSDATVLTIACGNASQTVTLTSNATDYTVTLSGVTAAQGQKVTISSTGSKKRWYIHSVEIGTGGASKLTASESGDTNSRVITGITSKNYTVSGLNQGGSYKFYVEANYTDGSKKESNVKTVTLEGTATPTPEIIVDPETLSMTANVGETVTATFGVLASDLTGNVTVTLDDANGVYSINPATISKAAAEAGATVTVTYAPTATGTHPATVTVASEGAEPVTVTLNGTAVMQTVAPVMAAATNVGTTSFTATWTDATPAQNVRDYTLFVNKAVATGDVLLTETFAGVNVTKDGTYDRGSSMDDYCDNAGWTGNAAYEAASGGFKLGSGSKSGYITTPALAANSGTLTVAFNGNSYGNDGSSIIVSCGDVSETIVLSSDAADYTVTLAGVPTAAGQKVTLSCTGTGKRVYVHSVTVYDGSVSKLNATETGDENTRVITGITAKTYTVENLTPGATYNFYVVANYVDNTTAGSNTEQVTLEAEPVVPDPEVIVDPETLTMTAEVGETVTATFDLLAANLTGAVTLTLNDENNIYSINLDTISIADAEAGATVTVTYAPTTTGTHAATVTVSSAGAEDVTVTLNGTATMEATAPVMLPAAAEYVTTSSFRADWTDETAARFIKDYTLYVNIEQVDPVGTLLLNETFYSEEVPSADSNIDEGANGTLDDCCDNAGWTGYGVFLAADGGMKLGSGTKIGYLTTPALDLSGSNGVVTVKFNARSYGSDGSSVIVSCGEVSDTVELTTENADYTVVLNGVTAEAAQNITLSGTAVKKRFYLNSVQVYSGEVAQMRAVEENGDENSRIITGITDKYYVVEGLTAGATYNYYVEANYIDGSKAASNVETVTLLENQDHGYQKGDVNHDKAVDINDVTALISYVLGNTTGDCCPICANVNGDTQIDINDVTALISFVLSGSWGD